MKINILKVILLLLPFFCFSQKQGNIWYFGNHAGLDFNTITPTPLLNGQTDFPLPNQWNEGSSSISDSSGNLLFYTNGMKIWNKQHFVMPNGNNLMGHSSSTQSSIIVPQPGSQRYFYVFTTDAQENSFQNGLRYNVLDICLDNGLGDVISSEKNIELLDTVSEKLICIKHANAIDYWIITHKFNSDAFFSFRLTANGIVDTIISHTGTADAVGVGQMVGSPNGQKIVYAITTSQPSGNFFLIDFDAATGVVSNEQILSSGERVYGVSFSPDNSKLYCSANGIGEVYQYNLGAGNLAAIIASKEYIVQNGPDGYRQHQLGPDGKIYLSRSGKSYLCRLEFPNNLFPSCNYIDSAIYLGGQYASFGLPNFITNYTYHNSIPQGCDTCIATPNAKFNYNPQNLTVTFNDQSGGITPNNWYWDFGDSTTSTEQNPQHVYDSAGTYIVTFIACADLCCDTTIDTLNVVDVGISEFNSINDIPILYQNTPNPFSEETNINFYLPKTVASAKMTFYDIMGKIYKEVTLPQNGVDSIIIKSSEFTSGVYSYSLIADDKTVSTKMMVKNK